MWQKSEMAPWSQMEAHLISLNRRMGSTIAGFHRPVDLVRKFEPFADGSLKINHRFGVGRN